MIILGINAYHSDSSACLVIDGSIVATALEQQFNNIPHYSGFPIYAIDNCLQQVNIALYEIDYIVISRDLDIYFKEKVAFFVSAPTKELKKQIYNNFIQVKGVSNIEKDLKSYFDCKKLNFKSAHVHYQTSHLASVYFSSPFNHAAILSLDGMPDFTASMCGVGQGNKIEVLDLVHYPNSLQVFYIAFAQFLGYTTCGDEYKLAQLAEHGSPIYKDLIKKILLCSSDGWYKICLSYFTSPYESEFYNVKKATQPFKYLFNDKFIDMLGPNRAPTGFVNKYYKNIAASVHAVLEEVIYHIVNELYQKTRLDNLCIAEGLIQSTISNGKLLARTPFKNIYMTNGYKDNGISMGAALYVHYQLLDAPKPHTKLIV